MARTSCSRPRYRTARCWAGPLLVAILWALALAPGSLGAGPSPDAAGVAVLRNGVVWVDEGHVLYQGFRSAGSTSLGTVEAPSALASSASDVALAPSGGTHLFLGGAPRGGLAPIEQIAAPVTGGECSAWVPASEGDWVVVGDELVDAPYCEGEGDDSDVQQAATREPLFVHGLSGGGWRVLQWLKGNAEPVLAAEGPLLAIALPLSCNCVKASSASEEGMEVSILDVPSGRTLARFAMPDGTTLSFASSGRLVLWTLLKRAAKAAAATSKRVTDQPELPPVGPRRYRLALYSLQGRRLGELPPVPEGALVSDMHVLYETDGVLAERSLLGGPVRALIGLDGAAQSILGLAFRWPAVAVEQTVRAPLSQSEVTCTSGEYHKPGPPFLTIFDLGRSEPFVPAPPFAELAPPPPSDHCPPVPVIKK